MKRMSAREASRGFSALIDEVYFNSEEVIIERDGHPVALVSPPPKKGNFEEFQRWLVARGPSSAAPEDDWQKEVDEVRALLTLPDHQW